MYTYGPVFGECAIDGSLVFSTSSDHDSEGYLLGESLDRRLFS